MEGRKTEREVKKKDGRKEDSGKVQRMEEKKTEGRCKGWKERIRQEGREVKKKRKEEEQKEGKEERKEGRQAGEYN